jgi:hypothetical protein
MSYNFIHKFRNIEWLTSKQCMTYYIIIWINIVFLLLIYYTCISGTLLTGRPCDWSVVENVSDYIQNITSMVEKSYTFVHIDHLDGMNLTYQVMLS